MSDHGYRRPTLPRGLWPERGRADALATMAGCGGRAVHGAVAVARRLAALLARPAAGPPAPGPARADRGRPPSGPGGLPAGQAGGAAAGRRLVAGVGQPGRDRGGQPLVRAGPRGADPWPGAAALPGRAPMKRRGPPALGGPEVLG